MKPSKIVPVILAVIVAVSWFSTLRQLLSDISTYNNLSNAAEQSVEDGLYEQAIELYKESLDYGDKKDTYYRIKEIYDMLYKEENTASVRTNYLEDMETASTKHPKEPVFWYTTATLYMDAMNYKSAFSCLKRAKNNNAVNEDIDNLYNELLYMTKLDYKLYDEIKTALNGYITVKDGDVWKVLDGKGVALSGDYKLIGLINDDGKGFYVNDIDARLLDEKEIPRARFDLDIEDAGYYNESSEYMPIKIDGVWRYLNMSGEFLDGSYEMAGSFYNHRAAVCKDKKWFIIDDEGNKVDDLVFDDIKLDLYGSYIQSGIVLAKQNGKYHIYDEKLSQISDFECDAIDICIDSNDIAFEKDGKWGYVDTKGKVVCDPSFSKAKSFSNGFAAVCDDSNCWGYINSSFETVISYKYKDAFYFNSDNVSYVSETENTYQLLSFLL